jgi:hypothetical protein
VIYSILGLRVPPSMACWEPLPRRTREGTLAFDDAASSHPSLSATSLHLLCAQILCCVIYISTVKREKLRQGRRLVARVRGKHAHGAAGIARRLARNVSRFTVSILLRGVRLCMYIELVRPGGTWALLCSDDFCNCSFCAVWLRPSHSLTVHKLSLA